MRSGLSAITIREKASDAGEGVAQVSGTAVSHACCVSLVATMRMQVLGLVCRCCHEHIVRIALAYAVSILPVWCGDVLI